MMRLMLLALLFLLAVPEVQAADILCPDLTQEKASTPGDVAGVQADIDRLNLCVERAKLLKQLDDIAGQRAAMLNKVTGAVSTDNFSANNITGIPPMPAGALPNLPNVQETKKAAPKPVAERPPESNWRVRKIWGQGAGMHAQIADGTGTLLNVVKGDPLPDGKVVETVSVRGVTISQNGKISDLSWDDASPPESSLNAPQQATP